METNFTSTNRENGENGGFWWCKECKLWIPVESKSLHSKWSHYEKNPHYGAPKVNNFIDHDELRAIDDFENIDRTLSLIHQNVHKEQEQPHAKNFSMADIERELAQLDPKMYTHNANEGLRIEDLGSGNLSNLIRPSEQKNGSNSFMVFEDSTMSPLIQPIHPAEPQQLRGHGL